MATIQITSNNYNGQTAQVTFYSVTAPTTAVNLGPQTLPYSRSGDDVYGSYELNFTAYNKVCTAVLNGPTTTTTTTAAPTSFTFSGAANSEVNGCYTQAGTYNGKPYYTNNTYVVWYEGYEFSWFVSLTVGGGPPLYIGSDENKVPTLWDIATGSSPVPIISSGCSASAYFVQADTASWGGKYCEDGTHNGKKKYRKIGTNYHIYWGNATGRSAWVIDTLANESNGSIIYILQDSLTPPVGNWYNADAGQDVGVFDVFYTMSVPITLLNTLIPYGSVYNDKPLYNASGGSLLAQYESQRGVWAIINQEDPDNSVVLYENSSNSNTLPLTGWIVADGNSPAPTLTGPNC